MKLKSLNNLFLKNTKYDCGRLSKVIKLFKNLVVKINETVKNPKIHFQMD